MSEKQTIDVGTEKQLFIDSRWFGTSHGMTLRVNPPIKAERVLTPEMPWESRGITPGGTILEYMGYACIILFDSVSKLFPSPSRSPGQAGIQTYPLLCNK